MSIHLSRWTSPLLDVAVDIPASMALVTSQGSSSTNYTSTRNFSFDVFLNFRGEDTRYGFSGYLYSALVQRGIKTFIDDEGLGKGEEISLALVKAIEGSRVSILVFSENYAASRWCLDELIEILDCMKIRKQLVMPVFYKIDPSVVRNQTGPYEKAMANHKKKMRDNKDKVNRWSSALCQAANLAGFHLEFGYEFQFIQNIVEDIWRRLKDPILLESQTSQVILQGLEFKNEVADKECYEVAASAALSEGANGKAEATKGTKKLLFFGNSSKNSEAAAPNKVPTKMARFVGKTFMGSNAAATSSSEVGNAKAEATNGGAKKLVFFGKSNPQFDLEQMMRASSFVLGEGTFGTSYKAVLEDGTVVAVKRLRNVAILEKELKEKIENFGGMAHENLMPIRGYYCSLDEKILFYDYLPMGSLSKRLHGRRGSGRKLLNFESIVLGAARGIEYLHAQGPNVCHANIKSSNVLLTTSYEARVSDYGEALLVGPSLASPRVSGYGAPEVTDPRKVTQKADVFSFGILLLEILTGKAPKFSLFNKKGIDLRRWVKSAREEWTAEVCDVELLSYQNIGEEMDQFLQLALDCIAEDPVHRPSMSEVTKQIEKWTLSTFKS